MAEKTLFRRLGIGTPEFAAVDDRAGLDRAVGTIGLPAVLKTRRGGYDGKGQRVVRVQADLDSAWGALGGMPLILERLVPFDREVSVLAVRGHDGDTAHWPLVENEHRDGILRVSRAPAPGTDDALERLAADYAGRVLDELAYVGVLAIELFQVGDDLFANELAPRVHNSGHWTIEGAVTSQFENHLRAVAGWPLGDTAARAACGMVNCIGALPDPAPVLAIPGAHLHDYGKAPRPGRKVGHVTVIASSPDTRDDALARLVELIE
jgi:5-(carboxyamino)imidazole ribonucleotide synthase